MDELFQSRREIEKVMQIIQEWQDEHPGDEKNEFAEEFHGRLDVLHMSW